MFKTRAIQTGALQQTRVVNEFAQPLNLTNKVSIYCVKYLYRAQLRAILDKMTSAL